jgi:hypothetical protein
MVREEVFVHFPCGHPEYCDNEIKTNGFRCVKFDKLMFPFTIERRNLHQKYDTFLGQEPMPAECESFEKIN